MKIDEFAKKYRENMEAKLINKGILFEHILDYDKVAELKNKWLTSFADGVKTDDIYINQFMWHIFSYKRVVCVEGDEATENFNSQYKSQCYILFQNHNDAYYLENAFDLIQDDIIGGVDFMSNDLYVVNKRFNWTYVFTHESDCGYCGPYYYHK